MAPVSEREVTAALASARMPDGAGDVVSAGVVSGLAVKDGHVQFALETAPENAGRMEAVRKSAEEAVRAVPGVLSVTAVLAAHRGPRAAEPPPAAGLLPQVGAIVAVASGKGGVGKSTTAANLALSFRTLGLRTAMLDADIYGPSLPTMMGISGRPSSPDGKTIIPLEAHGVTCMSIGFLVPADTAMIWRGPMVMGALEQMMRDVQWGPQDVLVVDMPPGTGDVQLTMAQRVPVAGAVMVSTPQDLALIDVRKGLDMFRKVDVPVLGLIENMSYFLCPRCGERSEIFTHGGARTAAAEAGIDFLGEIPLDMAIREAADAGQPVVARDGSGPHARAYLDIAGRIREKLGDGAAARPAAPRIVVE